MRKTVRFAAIALLGVSLLAGCQSDEEAAEEYYQSALEYIEAGDVDRAMIELRNVFNRDGFHREARQTYVDLLLERGQTQEAYSQLLRLVEQYPNIAEARQTLAELAIASGNWDEALRHGQAAIELAPEDPGVRAIGAMIDYVEADRSDDADARAAAVETAREVLDEAPESSVARRVLLQDSLQQDDMEGALRNVNAALELDSDSYALNVTKGQILRRMGDSEAFGDHLEHLYALFPENEDIGQDLIRWYMSNEDYEAAEAFLRDQAGSADETPEQNLTVVEFLRRVEGEEAARDELDRLIGESGTEGAGDAYRAYAASLDFEAGQQEEAIAALEEILSRAEPSDQTRRIKLAQARMLAATGNEVGARSRLEEILSEDATNVEALKMRAARLIQEDRPSEAIADLRTALDQEPDDTGTLMLMADAYIRDGDQDLAQDRLAQAVETSGNAPAESARYARFLLDQNRTNLAERVLNAVSEPNLETVILLGDTYLRNNDWTQARRVAERLRQSGDPAAETAAQNIQSAILLGQGQIDEGLSFLQEQIESGSGNTLSTIAQVVRAQIATGRIDEAARFVDSRLETDPDSQPLQLMRGSLYAIEGDTERAEDIFRSILEEDPGNSSAVVQLQRLLQAAGDQVAAEEVVRAAYEVSPDNPDIQLLEAYRREKVGDPEGAIEIYEEMYAANSDDAVVANNLASLLTMYREDQEDIDRGFAIARRFNDADFPAFRDTLGWIRYLRGDYAAAVEDLELAAEGLPEDPVVAFHLGLAYQAVDRTEEAQAELERGLELAGDQDLPQRAAAEEALSSM